MPTITDETVEYDPMCGCQDCREIAYEIGCTARRFPDTTCICPYCVRQRAGISRGELNDFVESIQDSDEVSWLDALQTFEPNESDNDDNNGFNIDNVTFGIEIECFCTREVMRETRISTYDPLPATFGTRTSGWNVHGDGSLSDERGCAMEIVSPPLHGLDGLREVEAIYTRLNELGFWTNNSCGLHVHVGLESILNERANDLNAVADLLKNVLKIVSRFEHALFAIGNSVTRMQNQRYCHSIKESYSSNDTTKRTSYDSLRDKIQDGTRYQTVNFENVLSRYPSSRTIEFRVYAHTMSADKVIGYILTSLAIIHRAIIMERLPAFVADRRVRNNDYANEVHRMHCAFAWNYDRPDREPLGCSMETWQMYGKRVLKNQRWNARRFNERAPRSF